MKRSRALLCCLETKWLAGYCQGVRRALHVAAHICCSGRHSTATVKLASWILPRDETGIARSSSHTLLRQAQYGICKAVAVIDTMQWTSSTSVSTPNADKIAVVCLEMQQLRLLRIDGHDVRDPCMHSVHILTYLLTYKKGNTPGNAAARLRRIDGNDTRDPCIHSVLILTYIIRKCTWQCSSCASVALMGMKSATNRLSCRPSSRPERSRS